ncbi:MAG: hypothetical protein ABI640_02155 [Gammaproteobacteria bacterium]
MTPKRKKRLLIGIPLLVVTLLLARLAIHEADAWIAADPAHFPPLLQVRREASQIASKSVPEAKIGFVGVPNETRVILSDDYTYTWINDAQGFPNRAALDRADVIFLGDSLLVGYGVGIDKGFVQLVDDMLPHATVLNLGNPGAGPERQLRTYEQYGIRTGAKLIVAGIYLASDFENDRHFRAWVADPLGMDYDPYRLSYDERHDTRSGFNLSKRLERHQAYSWLQSVVEPWFGIPHVFKMPNGQELLFDRAKVRFALTEYHGDETEVRSLVDAVDRLQTLAHQNGAAVAVLLIPSKEEVFAAPANAHGAASAVGMQLNEMGIPVLDLIPVLRARAREQAPYFKRDIHFNEFGSAVLAEAVANWVTSLPVRIE